MIVQQTNYLKISDNQHLNIISYDRFYLGINIWLYFLIILRLLIRLCQRAIIISSKIMKLADILALLLVKPEDMPEIETTTNKATRARIKYFQEIIQNQAMVITTCDHILGFLRMVLRHNKNHLHHQQIPDPFSSIPLAQPIKPLKSYASTKTTKKNSPLTVNFTLFQSTLSLKSAKKKTL